MNNTFRTEIVMPRSDIDINYSTPLMLIGSCFSDHIGQELKRLKFPLMLNPFGVLYNPASIARVLRRVLDNKHLDKNDLIYHNGMWHSFLLHGSFSHPDAEVLMQKANEAISRTHVFLKKASYLFVTWGTAWVFKHVDTNVIVSNCHKIPAAEFSRYRLNVSDIVDEWIDLLKELKQFNAHLKIVFTISPVRHLKDGSHENQLSKSTLFLATHMLNSALDYTSYFPSYEIMHDELRDYRFYAPDMVHIADVAVQYIFDKFAAVYFSKQTINCKNDMAQLAKAIEHRVEKSDRQNIDHFKVSMLKKISALEKKYYEIDFHNEKEYFNNL